MTPPRSFLGLHPLRRLGGTVPKVALAQLCLLVPSKRMSHPPTATRSGCRTSATDFTSLMRSPAALVVGPSPRAIRAAPPTTPQVDLYLPGSCTELPQLAVARTTPPPDPKATVAPSPNVITIAVDPNQASKTSRRFVPSKAPGSSGISPFHSPPRPSIQVQDYPCWNSINSRRNLVVLTGL